MKRRIAMVVIALVFIGTIFLPMYGVAASAWQANGNPVCTYLSEQKNPKLCSDGQGGAIIAWEDYRADIFIDIYAQKMSSTGTPQWTSNGTLICNATNEQANIQLCSDGAGGAILVWQDYRDSNADIYAQRVDSQGTTLWTFNGVPIVNLSETQENPRLCSDGAGGAIIVWCDKRSGQEDVYAQRITSNGHLEWTIDGIPICIKAGRQDLPEIISDGTGGAIMCWADNRSIYDIYAQRVDDTGVCQWGANGTVICNATNYQDSAKLCSDGAHGAIIVWMDYRNGNDNIYAQRITSAGAVQWTGNGTAICNDIFVMAPQICSVNSGGAIIAWHDYRGPDWDIYAQYVTQSGQVAWTLNGDAICNATNDQLEARICSDGSDGAIICWEDMRTEVDIYAQRVSSSGNIRWQFNGEVVCNHISGSYEYQSTNAGVGAAIFTWRDNRNSGATKNGINPDIYALKITTPSMGGDPGLVLLLLIIPIVGVAVGLLILYLRREQLE